MGVLGKLVPKKSSAAKTMAKLPVTTGEAALLPSSVPTSSAPVGSTAAEDPNDVPTYFTAFIILYYTFFGLTTLIYPYVHAVDGPFPNPVAYFTTITTEQAFAFRLFGAALITIVVGPWLDEIFGGAGVSMMAFTRQMMVLNTIFLFMFLYYSYYAPLATGVPMMFNVQAITNGLIFAWNFIEVTDAGMATYYVLGTCGMFGFFAVGLISVPDLLFGPPSPIAYWTSWNDLAMMTARSLGLGMFVLFILGFLYCGKTAGYAKLCTVWNVLLLAFCSQPAYFGGDASVASMWEIQFVFQIPFVVIGLYIEAKGLTGSWPLSFGCPPWGLNAVTFNFVNLLFFLPFVGAFTTYPNLVFGPSTPTGMPMFTEDMDEVALWFGRTWAVSGFLLALGPYLFGMPHVKVTKLLTVAYFLYCALFGYVIASSAVLNLMVAGPLIGVNFIFFAVGTYLSMPAQAGEDILYMA